MSPSGRIRPDSEPAAGAIAPVDAVVLAAGRGVRLGDLTRTTPKVLVEVNGRPLLDYHLDALRAVGVRRVVLVVHHFAEQIRGHVDDGRPFGLRVESVLQPEPLGTGDAIRVAGPRVETDPFLVCYADVFLPNEPAVLRAMLDDDVPKIAAAHVPDGGSYGRLLTREDRGERSLVGLEEKDGRRTPALVNAGIYLLPRSILARVATISRSARGEYEFTDAIREFVATGGALRVVPVADWVDAGTVESLARAEELARRQLPPS